MKFRKKPIVVDAIQWTGENYLDIVKSYNTIRILQQKDLLIIGTPEGFMTAQIGDWIIRGIAGELYPCKPDIFSATYDVED